MNNEELNKYIKHYLEKDQSKSAIMLTGAWGIGKSYYIQNELIPFLQEEHCKCVAVSLYGLKTLSDISKSIYLELRVKPLKSNSEFATTGKLIAKTLAKGIISHFGVDLKSTEEEMQTLYESIDLSQTLIILEDVERSQIDILDLLGYVNSLVEQDGVKVLLVANENEMIQYEPIVISDGKATQAGTLYNINSNRKYTEKAQKYLLFKEKTISDTIQFEGNTEQAILQIISTFKNDTLNRFANSTSAQEIYWIMFTCNQYNLRSFIFACQKSVDIFDKIEDDYEGNFLKCIFFGIIYFSLRFKAENTVQWDRSENYSIELGDETYPLFKFCFDYIQQQKFDIAEVPAAADAFKQKQIIDKKDAYDPQLQILFKYYIHTQKEVEQAVKKISTRLQDPEDISIYNYDQIAMCLIIVEHVLNLDIEKEKCSLVNNLKNWGKTLKVEELFRSSFRKDCEPYKKEFEELKDEIIDVLKKDTQFIPNFVYLPAQTDIFCEYITKHSSDILITRQFAKILNIPKLTQMFAACTPAQKQNIRMAFMEMYRFGNVKEFLANDAPAIEQLKYYIEIDMENQTDKIQRLQYEWFAEALDAILKTLT